MRAFAGANKYTTSSRVSCLLACAADVKGQEKGKQGVPCHFYPSTMRKRNTISF